MATFTGASTDGHMAKAHATLATALDATTADSVAAADDNLLGMMYYSGGLYACYRGVLFFDTSSIPDGATITSVSLQLTCKQKAGTGEVTHAVTTTNTAPLSTASYNPANFGSTSLGEFTANPTADTAYSATLTGLTINTTGTTAIGLRGADDLNRTADGGVNFCRWYSGDATTESYRPVLTVTWGVTQTFAANITAASTVSAVMGVFKLFAAAVNAVSSVDAYLRRMLVGTVTKRVAASSDDCRRYYDPAIWDLSTTSTTNSAGNVSTSEERVGCGMRFTALAIPSGATITSAKITFTSASNKNGTVNSRIYAEDTDDAATYSTQSNFQSRDAYRTTAYVAYSPPAWTTDSTYDTPDISTVVQEVVSRTGWRSGNDMALTWGDFADETTLGTATYRDAKSYDHADGETQAPLLTVTYSISLIDIAAAVLSESSVSAAMILRASLAAAVNGASTVSAAMGVKAVLAAVIDAASSVTSALTAARGIAAVIAAVSNFTAKIYPWTHRQDTASTWTERTDTSATWTERTDTSGDWTERDVS